jgi:glycosyltransferase involved in cell wall biosynthesis
MDHAVEQYLGCGQIGRCLAAFYMRQVYVPQFDRHVAVSDYTAAELLRQAPRHPRPVDVLPHGVDIAALSPHRRSPEVRRRLLRQSGGDNATRLLLYSGRLSPEKNLGLLEDTLEHLAGDTEATYRLTVAGDGPVADRMRRRTDQRLPGLVSYLGHVDRDRLASLLASVDVFVHPNPREPFGIGPLEALASGTPLVGPAAGGLLTYANADNAWLAAPTPPAFAAAVREVFADAGRRQKRVQRGLPDARRFAWPKVTERYFHFYENLVRAHPGSQNALPAA